MSQIITKAQDTLIERISEDVSTVVLTAKCKRHHANMLTTTMLTC